MTEPDREGGAGPGHSAPELPDDSPDPPVTNEQLLVELRRLNETLERFNRKRRYVLLSFTGGVTRGLGAAVGATVVFAVVLTLLSQLLTVPVVGKYVQSIVEFIQHNSSAASVFPAEPDSEPAPAPELTPAPE